MIKLYKFKELKWKLKASVKYFYSKSNKMQYHLKLIYFWDNTLHVSDVLSVHHQEAKTVNITVAVCTLSS